MERSCLPRLLVIGPLPPPVGGASISFELFCRLAREQYRFDYMEIINSSANHFKPRSRILTFEGIRRAIRILAQFLQQIHRVDKVLVFGTNGFILSLFPFLVLLARFFGKPCYLRVFGGSLDTYYENLPQPLRLLLTTTLQQCQRIIVQTESLYHFFKPWLKEKMFLVPGYRLLDARLDYNQQPFRMMQPTQSLRLIYLGHIKEEKGVFVLMESLLKIYQRGFNEIICDFFGPATTADKKRLDAQLSDIPSAKYMGIVSPDEVVSKLRQYDALVFPTYYPNEGHPGVILEAMNAGIPVITTRYRSIPDLVEHGLNGLLVSPNDSDDLAKAIQEVYDDRFLLAKMGENNYQRRVNYDARKLVPQIVQTLLD